MMHSIIYIYMINAQFSNDFPMIYCSCKLTHLRSVRMRGGGLWGSIDKRDMCRWKWYSRVDIHVHKCFGQIIQFSCHFRHKLQLGTENDLIRSCFFSSILTLNSRNWKKAYNTYEWPKFQIAWPYHLTCGFESQLDHVSSRLDHNNLVKESLKCKA